MIGVYLCGRCVNRESWRGCGTELVTLPPPWRCAACTGSFDTDTAHRVVTPPPARVHAWVK